MRRRRLTQRDVSILIILAALLFGAWLRLSPAWMAGFPVNDGGLFYRMILDLQGNQYVPPLYTSYNNIDIPYAYPPLIFYLGAGLSDMLAISPLAIVRWMPGIVNTLGILVFFSLAKELLGSSVRSAVATLVYALTPHMATWLSMGGGLTRSAGILFLMLTLLFAHRLFTEKNATAKNILRVILWGSLTILSHTESAVFAIAIPIYMWGMKSRSGKGLASGGLVVLGVLALAGPWFGFVILNHGLEPFLSAVQTGGQSIGSILKILNFDLLTQERYLDVLGALGLLGMLFLVVKREYFLPVMFLLIYLLQPRSAHTVGNIPLAMATATFIIDVLLPAINKGKQKATIGRGLRLFVIFATPFLFINALFITHMLARNHVTEDELAAISWVADHTPTESRFLVLSGESESMCDATAEWFPALSGRTSVTTLQGREWTLSNRFGRFLGHRDEMQACIDGDLACLEGQWTPFGGATEYIFIAIERPVDNCTSPNQPQPARAIVLSLGASEKYDLVYENRSVLVFQRKY